jgi:DNA-binding HxlR family transcriptional regulator
MKEATMDLQRTQKSSLYPEGVTTSTPVYEPPTAVCAIERTLSVIGERWSLLILRDAHMGVTRFAEFRKHLGIATNMLSARLDKLVAAGVMDRDDYQRPGERARQEYRLTHAGRELLVVLGALQQWGDDYLPLTRGPVSRRCHRETGRTVAVRFVDEDGSVVDVEDIRIDGPLLSR